MNQVHFKPVKYFRAIEDMDLNTHIECPWIHSLLSIMVINVPS